MFVDEVTITVRAGAGGDGCVSFRREKYVPFGGPDGGDGGRGGDVVLRGHRQHNTLLPFRHKHLFEAPEGRQGLGANKTGRSADALILDVPPGTVVWDDATAEMLADLPSNDSEYIVCRGGRGGKGNARFTSATNQAPRRADPGEPGEERTIRLELKLLADVGLIGFPNAGKSTLISRISAAKPKIGSYPFTTLTPNLGVVSVGPYQTFSVADVPGLIRGASEGHGLGTQFLRHIERTRVLAHLVDLSDPGDEDPVARLEAIEGELAAFSSEVADKPTIVVGTKLDAVQDDGPRTKLIQYCEARSLPFVAISAVSGAGISELVGLFGRYVFAEGAG